MHKPKTTTISIRIDEKLLEHLRHEARRLSAEWDRDVSYADLIREATIRLHPIEDLRSKLDS